MRIANLNFTKIGTQKKTASRIPFRLVIDHPLSELVCVRVCVTQNAKTGCKEQQQAKKRSTSCSMRGGWLVDARGRV